MEEALYHNGESDRGVVSFLLQDFDTELHFSNKIGYVLHSLKIEQALDFWSTSMVGLG